MKAELTQRQQSEDERRGATFSEAYCSWIVWPWGMPLSIAFAAGKYILVEAPDRWEAWSIALARTDYDFDLTKISTNAAREERRP